ncbi:MAG: cytochrome C oxidase subunit IV family protein [Sinimarinibacterium sp.]|jgi:hypothetical protein
MSSLSTGPSIKALGKTRIGRIWLILVVATLFTWHFGSDTGDRSLATAVVIAVAFIKIRLVGNYFMEIREAPAALRCIFEGYCLFVCAMILGLYFLS